MLYLARVRCLAQYVQNFAQRQQQSLAKSDKGRETEQVHGLALAKAAIRGMFVSVAAFLLRSPSQTMEISLSLCILPLETNPRSASRAYCSYIVLYKLPDVSRTSRSCRDCMIASMRR